MPIKLALSVAAYYELSSSKGNTVKLNKGAKMHTIRTKEYWLIDNDQPRNSRRKVMALAYRGELLRTRRSLKKFATN
jgi:hypothetical protein